MTKHCTLGPGSIATPGGASKPVSQTPPPYWALGAGPTKVTPHAHSKHHKCTAPPLGKVLHLPVQTTYPLDGGGGYPFRMHFLLRFQGSPNGWGWVLAACCSFYKGFGKLLLQPAN